MFKVVVVDDEQFILEGLKKAIPWSEYGCEVVAEASDGITGAHLIRNYKPDILYTDIRMPNVDGLSMLAGLRSEFPNMQITVLTGIRNFEYAQRAINLGVSRFLLKPSKMDELLESLKTMTDNLKKSGLYQKGDAPKQEQNVECENFIVRNTLKYINEHFTEKLTLVDVAEKMFVSQWHLSKLLNGYLNQSFSEIVNSVRIHAAEELLKDPARNISEVAVLVGFSDIAHFSKIFKKVVGVTAVEYRNRTA